MRPWFNILAVALSCPQEGLAEPTDAPLEPPSASAFERLTREELGDRLEAWSQARADCGRPARAFTLETPFPRAGGIHPRFVRLHGMRGCEAVDYCLLALDVGDGVWVQRPSSESYCEGPNARRDRLRSRETLRWLSVAPPVLARFRTVRAQAVVVGESDSAEAEIRLESVQVCHGFDDQPRCTEGFTTGCTTGDGFHALQLRVEGQWLSFGGAIPEGPCLATGELLRPRRVRLED